jgi:hypothetical protein
MSGYRSRVFLACAVVMTLLQVWAAWEPLAGQVIANKHLHLTAHFSSYAFLAIAWSCGLPRLSAIAIAAAVAALGLGQEAMEVIGHAHRLERADVLVDAAGAVAGALIGRFFR